ncbi:hypothetical protein V2J09_014650 [Rumex salicifolius]
MSSDFCAFEEPFYTHHRSNSIAMFNSEALLLADPFSALSDSSIDSILQEISEQPNATEAQSIEELAHSLTGGSSPINQMESLSLYQPTHFTNLQNSADFPNGFVDCSGVKLEEAQFQLGFDSPPISNVYFPGSEIYPGDNSMVRFLQRSYSHGSHLYDEQKLESLFQPAFSVVSESPDNGFSNGQFGGQIRRVLSTGDLPKKTSQTMNPSILGSKNTTLVDEASFKVGKYSAEEKKERIDRYRAKRSLRNFNKTIKYSCRKTLADSRPRIRGRFARNDEPIERARSVASFNRYDDENDHLWVDGVGDQRGGQFVSNYGESLQFDHEFIGLDY